MAGEVAGPNLRTYRGNCHCGAFRYSVKLAPLEEVTACNCSICSKKGYLWAFPASTHDFIVEKGDGILKSYEFGNKTMAHKFCPQCGTPVMGEKHAKGPFIGINVRAFRDLDLEQLKIKWYDGRALEPAYEAPKTPKPSNTIASKELYQCSCHCGNVTFTLQSEPIYDLEVTDCNCNICSRNACLWLYPPKDAIEVQGEQHLRYYSRYYKSEAEPTGHAFCSTCGVFVLNKLGGSFAGSNMQPINVRAINGIDLGVLKIKKADGKRLVGKPYVLDAEEEDVV